MSRVCAQNKAFLPDCNFEKPLFGVWKIWTLFLTERIYFLCHNSQPPPDCSELLLLELDIHLVFFWHNQIPLQFKITKATHNGSLCKFFSLCFTLLCKSFCFLRLYVLFNQFSLSFTIMVFLCLSPQRRRQCPRTT